MQLPQRFLDSLQGLPGYEAADFRRVHESGDQVTSIRLNPSKLDQPLFEVPTEPIPWTRWGYYLAERPSFTFDPLFHAGTYYVQEASSMLLEQAFTQHVDSNEAIRVLDLCAAPGGKSTHLQSLLPSGSLLVSNEVIRSRATVLRDNIIKWGTDNVVVTNNDPADFARLAGFFDVLVIDAPCSGSGLFRRDPDAISEWSPEQVDFCAARQKRILSDALPALKTDGLLLYSTCSYSHQEDEDILRWLLQHQELESLSLSLPAEWRITEVREGAAFGYRCWPHRLAGEGFFLALFRKKSLTEAAREKPGKSLTLATRQETDWVADWMRDAPQYQLVKNNSTVFAWPSGLTAPFQLLLEKMQVLYAGIRVGELMRNKLVPDHALALSKQVHPQVPLEELPLDTAISYLQRKDLSWEFANRRGWQLVTYRQFPLGWVNVLPNRVNNYYPKEFRILKDK